MKVLAIYNTDHIVGGGEISFTLTLKALVSAGCEVLAGIPAHGPLTAYLEDNGIRVEVLPQESFREGWHALKLIHPSREWTDTIKRFRPDIIHCNAVRSALYGQAVGRAFRIPTILHARKEMQDPLDPFLMRTVDAIICISNVVEQRFQNRSGGAALRVIYNAADVDQRPDPTKTTELRNCWLSAKEGLLVGLPGRLSPIKGQMRLINAVPFILQYCPETRFVLIGDEDPVFTGHESQLRTSVDSMNLQDRVVFAGFHRNMRNAYEALDIVVFPTSSEAFGRVVIEAGSARRALVTSNIDVMREILPANSSDFMVDCDNPKALANRIVELLQNSSQREFLARRLHDHVRRKFGIDAHAEQILNLYTELKGA